MDFLTKGVKINRAKLMC